MAGVAETATAGYSATFKYGVNNSEKNATWNGDKLTITGLKLGNYTVTESGDTFCDSNDEELYIHSVTYKVGDDETQEITSSVEGNTITITNKYDTAELEITKSVTGIQAVNTAEMNIEFSVTGGSLTSPIVRTLKYIGGEPSGATSIILTNQDGIRLGEEYTITENAQSAETTGYTRTTTVSGVEGTFTGTETNPSGKAKTNETNGKGSIEFVNSYKQDTREIEVSKEWVLAEQTAVTVDASNAGWPADTTVKVNLYRTINENKESNAYRTTTLKADKTSDKFTDLPVYEDQNMITYTVEEIKVEGKYANYFTSTSPELENGVYVIRNTEKEAGLTG